MKKTIFSVYGAGRVCRSDRMADGEGTRIARAFLDKTLAQLAKRSVAYFNLVGEHVFAYGEKPIHSVLFPSILDISRAALAELPITRKPRGGDESSGRVNYWTTYRDTTILLEVKHAFRAVRSSRLPLWGKQTWSQVVRQVKSIRTNEIREQALRYREDKLLAIALLIVPTWISRNSKQRIEKLSWRADAEIIADHENIANSIGNTEPSWSACWIVPKFMRIETYGPKRHEVHDGVNCFAFVKQIRR